MITAFLLKKIILKSIKGSKIGLFRSEPFNLNSKPAVLFVINSDVDGWSKQ